MVVFGKQLKMSSTKQKEVGFFFKPRDKLQQPQQQPQQQQQNDHRLIEEIQSATLQTHRVDSTLKRRGNDRFHLISTWNPRVTPCLK